jgi:hypothetical protein
VARRPECTFENWCARTGFEAPWPANRYEARGTTPASPTAIRRDADYQLTETVAGLSIRQLAARGHTLVTPAPLPLVMASQVLDLLVGRVGIEPTTN